jgi:hypothetical protein
MVDGPAFLASAHARKLLDNRHRSPGFEDNFVDHQQFLLAFRSGKKDVLRDDTLKLTICETQCDKGVVWRIAK